MSKDLDYVGSEIIMVGKNKFGVMFGGLVFLILTLQR